MSRNLLALSLSACFAALPAMAEAPRVATDIAPVHSLVARVMDGVGEPALIVKPGATPHEYSLRPSEAAALQEADLVFWIGEDLTPWMADAIETLSAEAHVISLLGADGTVLLNFREGALFEAHAHGAHGHGKHGHKKHGHGDEDHAGHGHDDHEHGQHGHKKHGHGDEDHAGHGHDDHEHGQHGHKKHGHGDEDHAGHGHDDHEHGKHGHKEHGHGEHAHAHDGHDPHAWLSPDNAATWLGLIAAELSELDPDNAAAYAANAEAAQAELAALRAEVAGLLDPARGGRFIVFHDAYQYFETSFDFPAAGAISLSDAAEPSPARIAEIQARISDEGIDCVLAEPQFNPNLVAVVLDGTDARTGVIDPLGAELTPGPDLYPTLLRNMAQTLVGCL